MNDIQVSCSRLDPSLLLRMLQSEDVQQQRQALLVACPCRNRYYDKEICLAVCKLRQSSVDGVVRERAHHVIGTLQERTRIDLRAVELLCWLAEQGYSVFYAPWLRKEFAQSERRSSGPRLPKAAFRDVPALIEALASEDSDEQKRALQVLCPGRTRQYYKRIWLVIFDTCFSADAAQSRPAHRAMRRLLAYAQGDPRAQEVLAWLCRERCDPAAVENADANEALLWALESPGCRSAHTPQYAREHPALRAPVVRDFSEAGVEQMIAAVCDSRRPREIRMALYALRQAGTRRASEVLQEYACHPEESVRKVAASLLGTVPGSTPPSDQ